MLRFNNILQSNLFKSSIIITHIKMSQFIDIAANLTDKMYCGIYNDKTKHNNDLDNVLERSWKHGVSKIIITGTSLEESKEALKISQKDDRLYCTMGCHPTNCLQFEQKYNAEECLQEMKNIILERKDKIIAFGEFGLDFDRLSFCDKSTQQKYFKKQLELSQEVNLPLFLHCRNAAEELREVLKEFNNLRGVIHSFDGTVEEAIQFIDMGFYIGLNGCSLKTEQNLLVVKEIPNEKILLETDCPWCDIRPTHAGYKYIKPDNILDSVKKEKWKADHLVKGRNEPVNIRQILDVVAGVKGQDSKELSDIYYNNAVQLFFPKK